jgi:DNA polymerase III subunit gamma/tau
LLSDLLNHFRNLLIFQISRGDLNLLEVAEAEVAVLKEQSGLAGTESLTRILEVLADAELRLRDTASKKILLEVTLLKTIEAGNAISLDSVLKQLNQLRGQGGAGFQPASSTTNSPVAAPVARSNPKNHMAVQPTAAAPATSTQVPPMSVDLAGLWTKLVEAVGRVSPFTRGYLVDAQPVSFDKNLLTIGFDPEFEDHLGLVDNARNHTLLQTKLAELGHANALIKFIKTEASPMAAKQSEDVGVQSRDVRDCPADTPKREPQQAKPAVSAVPAAKSKPASVTFDKKDFKNDPLIQKALEIFKGQIVEVRA